MADTKTPCQAAIVAANWWADRMCSTDWDNGDSDMNARIALMNRPVVLTETARGVFVEHLAAVIDAELDQWGVVGVDVDYHAPEVLMQAAEAAGVRGSGMTLFGSKTNMRVYSARVDVKAGYGAPLACIWQNN